MDVGRGVLEIRNSALAGQRLLQLATLTELDQLHRLGNAFHHNVNRARRGGLHGDNVGGAFGCGFGGSGLAGAREQWSRGMNLFNVSGRQVWWHRFNDGNALVNRCCKIDLVGPFEQFAICRCVSV